jgi:hypothetical protein
MHTVTKYKNPDFILFGYNCREDLAYSKDNVFVVNNDIYELDEKIKYLYYYENGLRIVTDTNVYLNCERRIKQNKKNILDLNQFIQAILMILVLVLANVFIN